MFIDLINNINKIINEDIPKFILNNMQINHDLYFNIINNNNIKNNTINIFDFIDIILYINNITSELENVHDQYLSFKSYIFLYIKQLEDLLKKQSINMQNEIYLYLENANANEIFNIFLLFNYIQDNNKNKILDILKLKLFEIKHDYYTLKKNYNYDNYFNTLSAMTKKSIGLTSNLIKQYDFINNNDFDINKLIIKKNNISTITSNDFYSVFNTSIHQYLQQLNNNQIINFNNNTLKHKIKYLQFGDILNTKTNEIFLYNYFKFYEVIKKNNGKNIQVYKSIFELLEN